MLADNLTVTIDYVANMIDKGKAFRAFTEFTIPAQSNGVDGEYALSVLTGEQVAILYNRTIVPNKPNIRYEVRTNAVTTNLGANITVRPQNPKKTEQIDVIIRPCDYSDAGDLSDIDILPGQSASGSNAGGDVYSPNEPKPIPEGLEPLVLLKNPNNEPCNVLLYYKWFHLGANAWD